jgi:predicted phosphoribosyltransferase
MVGVIFRDRRQAGRVLAEALAAYARREDVVVLALPRGGVPVGFEIARALDAPLDVFVVRKLGAPGQEELALGAIASGGVVLLSEDVVRAVGAEQREIQQIVAREREELSRREALYRRGRRPLDVRGKVVILVDDGLATGASMAAAVQALRALSPASIVVAVPVAPRSARAQFAGLADDFVCVETPAPFQAVGQWYEDFEQVGDDEVRDLLRQAQRVPLEA